MAWRIFEYFLLAHVASCIGSKRGTTQMRNATKVLAIYRELRQSLGTEAPSSEVLACAASLVELFTIEEGIAKFDDGVERLPFGMLPIDAALADGGWRVLSQEWKAMEWDNDYECRAPSPSSSVGLAF